MNEMHLSSSFLNKKVFNLKKKEEKKLMIAEKFFFFFEDKELLY